MCRGWCCRNMLVVVVMVDVVGVVCCLVQLCILSCWPGQHPGESLAYVLDKEIPIENERTAHHKFGNPVKMGYRRDILRSLQSWVSTIQSVELTTDVFHYFMKSIVLTLYWSRVSYVPGTCYTTACWSLLVQLRLSCADVGRHPLEPWRVIRRADGWSSVTLLSRGIVTSCTQR